jgi:hypothetical protein
MIPRLIWLFLIVAFGTVTILFSVQVWRAATSKHWPTTPGVVFAFYETPNYKYSVDGRDYTNSHASCNEFFNSTWSAPYSSKYAERYPLGAKVTVHYYPERPDVAVLETNFDRSGIIIVAAFGLLTSFCVAGFVFGWRGRYRVTLP